jgi:hypothetical protein
MRAVQSWGYRKRKNKHQKVRQENIPTPSKKYRSMKVCRNGRTANAEQTKRCSITQLPCFSMSSPLPYLKRNLVVVHWFKKSELGLQQPLYCFFSSLLGWTCLLFASTRVLPYIHHHIPGGYASKTTILSLSHPHSGRCKHPLQVTPPPTLENLLQAPQHRGHQQQQSQHHTNGSLHCLF